MDDDRNDWSLKPDEETKDFSSAADKAYHASEIDDVSRSKQL